MSDNITVILTFYNNVDYVDSALRQVRAIQARDFELLITDDGSSDGTYELLHERLQEWPRARLLAAEHNMGIAAIRNWAVREATGDFVWFLDCDDVWLPKALPTMRRMIQDSGADVAMVHAKRVTDGASSEGKLLESASTGIYEGEDLVRLLLTGGVRGYLWNKLIRRELLLQHVFPPRRAQEDFSVISRIVLSGARFACREEVLYLHVERMGSLTNSAIRSYSDLDEVTAEVVQGVRASRFSGDLRRELLFFEQWHLLSSVVNTSIRLGLAEPSLEAYVRSIRHRITWRRVMATGHFSRREGTIAAAMKVLGPAYAMVYRTYLARQENAARANGRSQ